MDLHILNTSPAVGAGTPIGGITNDFDGDIRPKGAGADIGADEFTTNAPLMRKRILAALLRDAATLLRKSNNESRTDQIRD